MATVPVNVTITIKPQTGASRTVFATWDWTKDYTASYDVEWQYATGDGTWFAGQTGNVTLKNSIYSYPENATKVRFRVKPISQTYIKNKKETYFWTHDWTVPWVQYNVPNAPKDHTPVDGATPDVEVNNFTLNAKVVSADKNTLSGEFQLVQDDKKSLGIYTAVKNSVGTMSVAMSISVGHTYKVRFRGVYNSNLKGKWSEYSSNVTTKPYSVGGVTVTAESETSVKVSWNHVPTGATGFKIEYTKKIDYFDHSTSEIMSAELDGYILSAFISGLDSGEKYYFRVAAKNDNGYSAWSPIRSIIVGSKPEPPTSWQSTSTGIIGEDVTLYWSHNSTDGSKETRASIIMTIRTASSTRQKTIELKKSDDSDISQYVLNTSEFSEDTSITWSVRTCGILEYEYSLSSVTRNITLYVRPYVFLTLYRGKNWYWNPFSFPEDDIYTAKGDYYDQIGMDEVITKYPFYISSISGGGSNQRPISCYWSIYADEAYETEDYTGETVWINKGEEIYYQESNINKHMQYVEGQYEIGLVMLPTTVRLENGIMYRVKVTVTMNSGLTTKAEATFIMALEDGEWDLNAEMGYDPDTVSMYIQPTVSKNENSPNIEYPNVRLAVFRRDYDGKFIELISDILAIFDTTVTDPHPPLDYARYRIVGTSVDTGNIFFTDLPPYEIPETSIIIQWDEQWRNFDTSEPDAFADPVTSGSMLKLPYNITTDETTDPDSELIEYAGREHPVSYYGTQIRQSANWSTDIPRYDKETLFGLRRLQRYMGNVYVREPNGTGYWANIKVSMNIENKAVIIPVSLTVKRVEGGV